MGLRDRLKEKVKGLLGAKKEEAPPVVPAARPAPAPVAAVAPERPPAPSVPTPIPVAVPAPAPVPAVADVAAPVAAVPTLDTSTSVAATPAESSPPTAPPPAELRSGNDSPTRAAHLRPTFGTTTQAFRVRVYSEPEKLDIHFPCEPGEYIVEAAERAGFELPSSCRNGGCLTCTGKLMEGEAEIIEDQYVLEDHQIAVGFRLLCITTPRSDVVFMSHQQEEL